MSTQVRERVSRSEVRSVRVNRLPFGLSIGEAIALLIAFVLLVSVVTYYFSSLRPERDRLLGLEAELREQQKNIIASKIPGSGPETPVVDSTKIALETLESFKNNHLKPFSSGRIALIKEINALAKKNNVALTSGIDMGSNLGKSGSESETSGTTGKKSTRRKKGDEILNAIPSVTFRFSAFGQYSNLRALINELEHEKQFLVINSINLANQEARTSSRRSRGEGSSGVMLTIEISTYFHPM